MNRQAGFGVRHECKLPNCGRVFNDPDELERHYKKRHNNESVLSDEKASNLYSASAEIDGIHKLRQSVSQLSTSMNLHGMSDEAIYAKSIIEVELENNKMINKYKTTADDIQQSRETISDEYLLE